jgi:hypothetical protein
MPRSFADVTRFPTIGHKRAVHKMILFLLFLQADEDKPKRLAFVRAGGGQFAKIAGGSFTSTCRTRSIRGSRCSARAKG